MSDDMTERKVWKQYMKAYEACMSATSTKESPWYVVPADDKKDAQLIVSQILLDTLGETQDELSGIGCRRNGSN